jgi:hypothetical protein
MREILLEHPDIQGVLTDNLLQTLVFLLECFQPLEFTDDKAGAFGFPVTLGSIALLYLQQRSATLIPASPSLSAVISGRL